MSLTATLPSQAVAEWVRLFPKQVTETYTSSITFMKQLTIVAVSTISYLKNIFPEENYKVENFGGVTLRILRKDCKDELAQFLSTALTQAFEAFEKKYLHKLAVCFYDGECDVNNLIEYHVFEYAYTQSGVTMDVTSKTKKGDKISTIKYTFDNVRDKTVAMIRNCVVMMQTCSNEFRSADYDISIRLYYNEDAPDGYQAPGFMSCSESEDHLEASPSGAVTVVGSVFTPYHRVVVTSYMRDSMPSSHDAQPSQNAPVMTQNEDVYLNSEKFSSAQNKESFPLVVCPCGRTDRDNIIILTCQYCNRQQHAVCFGLFCAVQKHCCTRCSDVDPTREPTDTRLAEIDTKKRESLCIFRRTLSWCSGLKSVGVLALVNKFQLSQLNATKLIKLLQSNGVIEDIDTDIMSQRKVIPEKLNHVIKTHFVTTESDLVDRLVAETLSQRTHSDPIGEVLGPMETVSLQNASTLGKIIEPQQDCVMQDATLNQYKNATLSNQQTEELPLSGNHNPVKDMDMIGKKCSKRKAGKENVRTGVKTKRAKPMPK